MNFLSTFRGRLLLILALLLITTLSVQYYLNLQRQNENARLLEQQEQAFLAGIALGFNSLTSDDRLRDFVKQEGQPFYDKRTTERIQDILIINSNWQVNDSLTDKYLPTQGEDDEIVMLNLMDIKDLPPLMEGRDRLGDDIVKFPNRAETAPHEDKGEAHAIPIETSDGRWYVMVILKPDNTRSFFRAAQPLAYTLAILLISIGVTIALVWRFTRPIAELSKAARRVGRGEYDFRLAFSDRNDEIGHLTSQFNVMTKELEKNRDLQKQLQEAEKSAVVGRLASAIAHEIRNPLNYINLSLDHLRNKFAPEEEEKKENFRKLTEQLKIEVDRINRQVSDFLRYSRPVKLDLKPMNIRPVIEDSLRIVEPQAKELAIKVSFVERDGISKITGDSEVLRSVFNNLLINSVQAMESTGGKLSVITYQDGDTVIVEVKDTGVGIPEENLEKIFQPYFSTKETGTGLGLAIVRKIIDDHSGQISIDSRLGEGTTITVRVPSAKKDDIELQK
ncbi:MAG: HAMP domain-containing protein [Pyrinomonadaceae bacterium]|nr:HAMP domain-containing protein [Pyrinomonadaceae bacterium]